jgi:hypothetical protein
LYNFVINDTFQGLEAVKMHWLTLCVLSGVLLVYILVGGAIFMALEKENEDDVTTTQFATFTQFLSKFRIFFE